MKKNLLRLPQGTESLYLEETFRHRRILRQMEDLTERWGYLPVQTPVFDFYDNYRDLLDSNLEQQTYKLIDRDGELLMLRSDITLFLARQMGMTLAEDEFPVRVHYADSTLRYKDHEDIASHEFFQTGCELIGKPGLEGDLEILFLLAELLQSAKLPESRIHVGSTPLFRTIAGALNSEGEAELSHFLQTREEREIRKTLGRVYKKEDADSLTKLLLFIGSREEYCAKVDEWNKLLDGSLRDSLSYLEQISSGWAGVEGFDSFFNIDLSETGNQPYYSGIVFSAFTDGCGSSIASGGRYDGLLDHFGYSGGKPASSVGFSLFLRKLERLSTLEISGKEVLGQNDETKSAADKLAETRKNGPAALSDTPPKLQ